MQEEYSFDQSVKNPYTKKLVRKVTVQLDVNTIEYFKELALETDIPYQKLINLYLRNCAEQKIRPDISWSN